MHELSLALSLLEEVSVVAEREGAARVTSVHLRLGSMSGIVRDALLFSWEVARVDTVASEATLVVDVIPVAVWCPQCNAERALRDGAGLICGECGTLTPTIVHGRELELVGMEVMA